MLILLAACTSLPAPTPVASSSQAQAVFPSGASESPQTAAVALIQAERDSAIDGDLTVLGLLWTEDARIIDGRGTPEVADDYVWAGRDAILDRYELAVLPAPPPPLQAGDLDDLQVTTDDDVTATAELGVDRWTMTWQEGRWWLAELRYN